MPFFVSPFSTLNTGQPSDLLIYCINRNIGTSNLIMSTWERLTFCREINKNLEKEHILKKECSLQNKTIALALYTVNNNGSTPTRQT